MLERRATSRELESSIVSREAEYELLSSSWLKFHATDFPIWLEAITPRTPLWPGKQKWVYCRFELVITNRDRINDNVHDH